MFLMENVRRNEALFNRRLTCNLQNTKVIYFFFVASVFNKKYLCSISKICKAIVFNIMCTVSLEKKKIYEMPQILKVSELCPDIHIRESRARFFNKKLNSLEA